MMENNKMTNEDKIVDELGFFDEVKVEETSIEEISKRKEPRYVPSNTGSELLEESEKLTDDIYENLPENDKEAYAISSAAVATLVNPDDIGERPIKNVTNKPKDSNDNELTMKELQVKKAPKSADAALVKLTQMVGAGYNTNVPLWHSGFWVNINPMLDETIVNLELELAENINSIGKKISVLALSNMDVMVAKVIVNYFKDQILSTSVKIDDKDDLLDLISINDIYIIALGMAKSLYPKGFDVNIPCDNVIRVDENNNTLKCNYIGKGHIDLDKLLWVDRSKLNLEQLAIMSKKAPKSVTVEDVKAYQDSLSEDNIINFNTESGVYSIRIKTPSVKRYLEYGEFFVNLLEKEADELLKKNKDINDKETAKEILLEANYLAIYLHYIDNIKVDDIIINDLDKIYQALKILSSNGDVVGKLIDKIKDHIDESHVAVVGIPNFRCPKCGKPILEESKIIPLNMYEYFLDLTHSRYKRILEKFRKMTNYRKK